MNLKQGRSRKHVINDHTREMDDDDVNKCHVHVCKSCNTDGSLNTLSILFVVDIVWNQILFELNDEVSHCPLEDTL